MIGHIEQGDILKCLNCGEPIEVNRKTFTFDIDGEYIFCPKCQYYYDVQAYHVSGEKLKRGDNHDTID